MTYSFTKMHGCGNDYIYFDCMKEELPNPESASITLSDRHFGIGGDGIVMICSSDVADAKMRMFNADGSEGKMCGNAIRCVGKYLYEHNIAKKDSITVETLSGIKTLQLTVENGVVTLVKVNMGKAILTAKEIPVICDTPQMINQPLVVDGNEYRVTCVSMGNPHCVLFGEDPYNIPLEQVGPKFENHVNFPERINTEFIQVLGKNRLKMRVWERGSGETWACGTGACAAVVAAVENGYCDKGSDVTVELRGGELTINYTDDSVMMTGSATVAFTGTVELS